MTFDDFHIVKGGRMTVEVAEDRGRDLHAQIRELAVANDPVPGLRGPTGAAVPAATSRKLRRRADQGRAG